MKKIECLSAEEIKEIVINLTEESVSGRQIYN